MEEDKLKEILRKADIRDLRKYICFANKSNNFSHDRDCKWHRDLAKKIQNVLDRLEDLEELNKDLFDTLDYTDITIEKLYKEKEGYKHLLEAYSVGTIRNIDAIDRDKIEDKIKEYEETADEDNPDDFIRISVLKELLE